MSNDSKAYRECLFGGFTLYSLVEVVRAGREALATGSKVFASVPSDVMTAYPRLNDMVREGVIPLLQKNMQPQDFEQLTHQVAYLTTTYHQQILVFTPLAAAILTGVGVFLYGLLLTLPIFLVGLSLLEEDESVLFAIGLALAVYWPGALIGVLVVCTIGYIMYGFANRPAST